MIRRASGVRLSHDGMRHGFGTHRQVLLKNIAAVSGEMGNSVAVCRRHYANPFCTEVEAGEWFSLVPSSPQNVVPLPTAVPAAQGQPEASTTPEMAS